MHSGKSDMGGRFDSDPCEISMTLVRSGINVSIFNGLRYFYSDPYHSLFK